MLLRALHLGSRRNHRLCDFRSKNHRALQWYHPALHLHWSFGLHLVSPNRCKVVRVLIFRRFMILGYMFVPGNPLTRQRKRSAPQYDPDDDEDEETFRGREPVAATERVS